MDVPFWPQLPLASCYEDMYVQASEHFPGIVLDMEKRTLRFSIDKFMNEFEETMAHTMLGERSMVTAKALQCAFNRVRRRR